MLRKIAYSMLAVALCSLPAFAQSKPEPQPRAVDPGGPGKAPSDATVLFDGRDLSQWAKPDGTPSGCRAVNGEMVCPTGSGHAVSKPKFRSAQLHLEFAIPNMPGYKSQMRGNSGVYLHGRYEIQILDSYKNETYPTGHCGALYGQAPPLVLASRPPEQWQNYDIIFHAPTCDASGNLARRGTVTVLQNGVLVQDHVEIKDAAFQGAGSGQKGCSAGIGDPGPLMLQDHSGFPGAPKTVMKFRNIWFRPLED